jgi:arylsulfatase A-like enzyme/tetratricopeptide (TPR) repeat protein
MRAEVRREKRKILGKYRNLASACLFLFALRMWGQIPAPDSNKNWNVVLISIDTLRADHVGAYGYTKSVTPNLDRLATEGILFEHVDTPVPLTLPAHTSLLTGQYPPRHGVRDNSEALSDSVPTLAENLHNAGLSTAAFVGAFILDRRFGLARGFDDYWGDFQLYRYRGKDPGTIQIRGDRVEAAAEEWIAAHRTNRFFAFVHFYDLHGPYLLPEPWQSRFGAQVYDGELAFTDDLIGHLWSFLQNLGLADHTVLIITSDHGEGLGDHGERHHGFFLYDSTIHVPLILHLPAHEHAGLKVSSVASLIDIAPTICSLVGAASLPSFQGRSLLAELDHEPLTPHVAYSETLYPYLHFHTAPAFAIETERYSFISLPRRELYDLHLDPQQSRNLAPKSSVVANRLAQELSKFTSATGREGVSRISPDAMKALNSLGYVGPASTASFDIRDYGHLPDPKDRIGLFSQYQDALALEYEGKLEAAATGLEKIAASDPALVNVQIDAGLARRSLDQERAALSHFKAAARADPNNALAHFHLGVSLRNLGRDREAEQELAAATKLQPWFSQAYTARGLALARLGNLISAKESFDHALSLDPEDFDAWLNRGKLLTISNQWDGADQDLKRALALEPDSAQVHQAIGTLAFHRGNLDEASEEYGRAIHLDGSDASIHADLGLLYGRLGRYEEARTEFQKALALDPSNQEASDGLRGMH